MDDILSQIGDRIIKGANAPNFAFLVLMLALVIAPLLSKLARLPSMVGLVLVGMLVGPHALGVLATEQIALSALGTLGLLYLMFAAGLELDLRALSHNKRAAIGFAALSFAIPFGLGITGALALGYAWAAAVLMGSNWASHTLVTYPMLRRLGLARERSVSTVVGATAVTDTSALLVLAWISVSARRSGSFFAEGAEAVIGLVVLFVWSMFGLPRVGRWLFGRVGTDEAQRLLLALVALLIGAILAEAAGIDGIVGAFFAGLGLGRAIPGHSPLMDRIEFLGSSILIPTFLVSVGVLLDPHVLVQPKTLLIAAVFCAAVLGGKAAAAIVVGRIAGFRRAEVGVIIGLSGSQAAATLATTLVGARLKLFDAQTVNAVLVVILVTLVITPIVANRSGRRLAEERTAVAASAALAHKVVVHVSSEDTRPLLLLAGELAQPDQGIVVALSLAGEDATDAELAKQRELEERAAQWLGREGLESISMCRVCPSVTSGIKQTVRSEDATLVLTEWMPADPARPGRDGNAELARALRVPTLLGHGEVSSFDRLVLVARAADIDPNISRELTLAMELAERLATLRSLCIVTAQWVEPMDQLRVRFPKTRRISGIDPFVWIEKHLRGSDLVLFAGLDAVSEAERRVPWVCRRRFLAAVAPRPFERASDDPSAIPAPSPLGA